jgi:hypothetical protein
LGRWFPGSAAKQQEAAEPFHQPDLVVDRSRRHRELARRCLETQMLCGGLEGKQSSKRWQVSHLLDEG